MISLCLIFTSPTLYFVDRQSCRQSVRPGLAPAMWHGPRGNSTCSPDTRLKFFSFSVFGTENFGNVAYTHLALLPLAFVTSIYHEGR